MSNIFFISDTHWGHSNVLTFTKSDGGLLRPGFANVQEMDEHMIKQWNSVVRPQDKVYHLGDVCFGKNSLDNLARCNGEKVLVKGNHDKDKLSNYQKYFKDVRGSHQFEGILMTHIPVHPNSLGRWPLSVHGHMHSNQVTLEDGRIDARYLCVSVEQLDDYKPISLEDARKLAIKRKEIYG